MNSTSLNHKTIRPGSLLGYSYYHSSRTNYVPPKTKSPSSKKRAAQSVSSRKLFIYLFIILGVTLVVNFASRFTTPKPSSTTPVISTIAPAGAHVATPAVVANICASTLTKHVLVSVGQRHLYACAGGKSVYDSPIVTGISYLAADITPIGTYSIYAKQTDTDLTGSDTTGAWNDHVNYWLPFLQNQYGTYGFHDATWRNPKDFGKVDPNSANASHGCVELPLAASKWLYNWVEIGTQITINS